jgi:hypothetical protein
MVNLLLSKNDPNGSAHKDNAQQNPACCGFLQSFTPQQADKHGHDAFDPAANVSG